LVKECTEISLPCKVTNVVQRRYRVKESKNVIGTMYSHV
jgi:hypothetical protein